MYKRQVVEEEIGGQWLVLTTEPEEAMVYIDEVYEAGESGRVQKFLPLGRHAYRVDYALYHPEAGQVELTSGAVSYTHLANYRPGAPGKNH